MLVLVLLRVGGDGLDSGGGDFLLLFFNVDAGVDGTALKMVECVLSSPGSIIHVLVFNDIILSSETFRFYRLDKRSSVECCQLEAKVYIHHSSHDIDTRKKSSTHSLNLSLSILNSK